LIFFPVLSLVVSSIVLLVLWPAVLVNLWWQVRLLVIILLVDVEDLLVRPSLWLVLTSVVSWGVSVVALSLLVLCLFFQSFVDVVIRSAVFLELVVQLFNG
jgi:hypothetical protein